MEQLIERLKYEVEHGESSLDICVRVYGALRTNDMRDLAERFNSAYTDYYNDDTEIPKPLLEEVYSALNTFPEPEEKKGLLD